MAEESPTRQIPRLERQQCAIRPGNPREFKAKHLNFNDLELEHIVNHSISRAVLETGPFTQAGSLCFRRRTPAWREQHINFYSRLIHNPKNPLKSGLS
jgi:hypothetical protein